MFPGLFYVKVVFSMDDATVFMLKKGQTSISNLLLENYTDLGLNDGEFLLLLMLMKFDQQKEDVDLEALSKMMGKTDAEIGTLLNNLIVKKVVDLRTVIDASGRQRDCYDLSFLYEKLVQIVKNQLRTRSQKQETATKEQVFDSFQKEFGRPLSSIELEEIRRWMEEDGYSPEIILLALKEAVLSHTTSNILTEFLFHGKSKTFIRQWTFSESRISAKRKKRIGTRKKAMPIVQKSH